MLSMLLKLLIKYLEAHPDQILVLVEQAITAIINALKQHNAAYLQGGGGQP